MNIYPSDHCIEQHCFFSGCFLISQVTACTDEASDPIIVHLEEWKVVGKNIWKFFGTVCNYLASFNISPVCSGLRGCLPSNSTKLGHPRVRYKVVWLKPDKRLLLQTDRQIRQAATSLMFDIHLYCYHTYFGLCMHSGPCVGVCWAIALSNNANQLSHPRVVWLKPDKRLLLQTATATSLLLTTHTLDHVWYTFLWLLHRVTTHSYLWDHVWYTPPLLPHKVATHTNGTTYMCGYPWTISLKTQFTVGSTLNSMIIISVCSK